jgi:hypothetical protein
MSRAESARDFIAQSLGGISTSLGYRNTVGSVGKAIITPDKVVKFPHLAFELGVSKLKFEDDARTICDELTNLFIVGYVKSDTATRTYVDDEKLQDAMESLVHDLKRKITSDILVEKITGVNRWNVELGENELTFERTGILGERGNFGIVSTSLVLRIRWQDKYFAELLFDEAGTPLQSEDGSFIELEYT